MKTDCIRFLRHRNLMLSTNHRTKLFLYHLLTFQLEVLYTDVNIKIKNMNTSIKNILASWESSLIRFQKIDCWNYSENLATLGWYLHNNNCTIEEYYLIKYVRDSIIGVNFNVKSVLNAIQKLMNMETAKEKDFTSILVKMDGNRIVLNGQDVRFKKETEKILRRSSSSRKE